MSFVGKNFTNSPTHIEAYVNTTATFGATNGGKTYDPTPRHSKVRPLKLHRLEVVQWYLDRKLPCQTAKSKTEISLLNKVPPENSIYTK